MQSKNGKEKPTKMQEEGKKSGADKWWARRCELEGRIQRRVKMMENIEEVVKAKGMSMKEYEDAQQEKDKIREEMEKLRREIRGVDKEVRWREAFEDAVRAEKEAKRAKAEKKRGEEKEEWERMEGEYGDWVEGWGKMHE
jgi:hypothetical protein